MDFPAGAMIGFFLGFAFGVGCALAVMYSIYRGGYRAAVRDMRLEQQSDALKESLATVDAELKASRAEE